jgi:hypothetical protein
MKKQYVKPKPNTELLLWIGIGGIALCTIVLLFAFSAFDSSAPRDSSVQQSESIATVVQNGDVQEVKLAVLASGYEPANLVVEEGKPVRMLIDATKMSGCTSTIMSRELGFRKQLQRGENIIEFTAPKAGTYGFSCGMGMAQGTITVIAPGDDPNEVKTAFAAPSGSCSMGGCGG